MQEHDERMKAAVEGVKSWGPLPVVLFLGAGASAAEPLGLPTTANFWQRAEQELGEAPSALGHLEAIITANTGSRDVEDLWPTLELCEKDQPGLRPLLTLARALRHDQIALRVDNWSDPKIRECGGDLRAHLMEGRAWLREALFDVYGGFTDPGRAQAATDVFGPFLQGLYRVTEAPVLPIFTTNYDLALEAVNFAAVGWPAAVRRDGRPWDRAVEVATWEPRHYDFSQPAAVSVAVVKLHGSLNWELRTGDDSIIVRDRSIAERAPGREDVLIYPGQHGGMEDEWPFAQARAMLRQALTQTERCVVVGFSMRSPAIANVFRAAMARSDFRVLLLDPAGGLPGDWYTYFADFITQAEDSIVHEPVAFGTDEALEAVRAWW